MQWYNLQVSLWLLYLYHLAFCYPEEFLPNQYADPARQQAEVTGSEDHLTSQQSFYPAFSPFDNPPLGHSRPFFYQQERAYSQRPQSAFDQQGFSFDTPHFGGFKEEKYTKPAKSASTSHASILGSGNFGVIEGGTFYDGGDGPSRYKEYDPFYRNGHGRPKAQQEQFANFRDFADINAPSNPAYSEYTVVYANKNQEKTGNTQKNRPKNIIESLVMLDSGNDEPNESKVSKSKEKLSQTLKNKKRTAEKSLTEHLLALS